MNYSKLDAALIDQLDQTPRPARLNVFIQTVEPLTEAQASELAQLGISGAAPQQKTFTATVNPELVDKLSERPWIKQITLSKRLRPLDET